MAKINQWALAFLRLVLGLTFMYHGYLKIFVPGGFVGTVNLINSINIPLPVFFAAIVSAVEFLGGIFLLLGTLTKWSSGLLMIDMAVAFFAVHLKNGLPVSKGGFEFVLVLFAGLLMLYTSGAGKISLGSQLKNMYLR